MDAGSRQRLGELLFGFMPSQLVHVMARLQIADRLVEGPMSVQDLGSAIDAHPTAVGRLVRGLANLGLVELGRDGRVSLTEMGALLGSDARGSMRDVALHFGGEAYTAWSELDHAVRTGDAAFEAALGHPFFSYLERNADAGRAFDGAMTQMSLGVITKTITAYDFTGVSKVLDIGGGHGHFVATVLEAHPRLEGAVFDQPHVTEAAAGYLADRGLSDRCTATGGSFFESLPEGYDLHILKWILHDWNDESCLTILAASRSALPSDGRLLVVERLLPDETPVSASLHLAIRGDLNMLVNFGDAVERSLTEYEALLGRAGFAVHEVVALPDSFSLLDCRPHSEP